MEVGKIENVSNQTKDDLVFLIATKLDQVIDSLNALNSLTFSMSKKVYSVNDFIEHMAGYFGEEGEE